MKTISFIIPLYNEQNIVYERLKLYLEMFNKILKDMNFDITLVDNGSNDKTKEEVNKFIKLNNCKINYIRINKPNYGLALKTGAQSVPDENYIYFVDIDQLDFYFLKWSISNMNKYDLICSSKRIDFSINKQSAIRRLLSFCLNTLINILFSYPGSDTHGQKLLSPKVNVLAKEVMSERGQFDVELCLMAHLNGLNIAEASVPYEEIRISRNILIKKILWNVFALFKLYIFMKKNNFKDNFQKDIQIYSREDLTK